MEPSIHLSTQMNTPTHRTAAGSSRSPTDTEFISTSPYCRQSPSLITSLSGKFECVMYTHTHTHSVNMFLLIAGLFKKRLLILACCFLNEPSYMTTDQDLTLHWVSDRLSSKYFLSIHFFFTLIWWRFILAQHCPDVCGNTADQRIVAASNRLMCTNLYPHDTPV